MKLYTTTTYMAALMILTACGGGSGGGSSNLPDRPTSALGVEGLSFAQVSGVSDFVIDEFDDLTITPNPRDVASGSASYYGNIVLTVGEDLETSVDPSDVYLGVLALDVDFDGGLVTGDAGSFFNAISKDSAQGTLSFENGTVFANGSSVMQGDFEGTLALSDGSTEINVEDAGGFFLGAGAEGNSGLGTGEANTGTLTREALIAWQILAD